MVRASMAIDHIDVHQLFGSYDYKLRPAGEAYDPDHLLIFYGDNGSGKTTILSTLFHLLAPEGRVGHKSAVAAIPFAKFEVGFASGDRVWAARPNGQTTGSFVMGIQRRGKKEVTYEYIVNDKGSVPVSEVERGGVAELRELNIGLYFLSDDRTVQLAGHPGDTPLMRPEFLDNDAAAALERAQRIARTRADLEPGQVIQRILLESIKRAEIWIQSQAVRGASQGESNVNALYGEILKRISRLPLDEGQTSPDTIPKIGKRLDQLETRSKQYAQYGLLPEFRGRDILTVIRNAPQTHLSIVTNVVTPYLESVEQKLDAMERLQSQLDAFVTIVNSFFTRKQIKFDMHKGFEITADDGRPLVPYTLSSGERHLLLLFCNTLITLDRQSIFIIDEPEISLNIKWQRRLLASLLQIAGENPVQYLVATHSFELLAQHRWNVIKLSEMSE